MKQYNARKNRKIFIVLICAVAVILGMLLLFLRGGEAELSRKLPLEIYIEDGTGAEDRFALQSFSQVKPYVYEDPDGNQVVYYYCHTTYAQGVAPEDEGLNMDALKLVVDFDALDSKTECEVNTREALQCELEDRIWLCWTLSPEVSCVIEYPRSVLSAEEVMKMAESISPEPLPFSP